MDPTPNSPHQTHQVSASHAVFAEWLREARRKRGLSVDELARVTKIQPRILAQLESPEPTGLPAPVFVRGFVRSLAKCLGANESDAIACYDGKKSPLAVAFVDSMAALAPVSALNCQRALTGIPDPTLVPAAAPEPILPKSEGSGRHLHAGSSEDTSAGGAGWVPQLPPTRRSSQVIPWFRPAAKPDVRKGPTLSIDDDAPELAEQVQSARGDVPEIRTHIPSVLLHPVERERQGGLTLAVIILLIAATLTLSYLMRLPGAGGDGLTQQAATMPYLHA